MKQQSFVLFWSKATHRGKETWGIGGPKFVLGVKQRSCVCSGVKQLGETRVHSGGTPPPQFTTSLLSPPGKQTDDQYTFGWHAADFFSPETSSVRSTFSVMCVVHCCTFASFWFQARRFEEVCGRNSKQTANLPATTECAQSHQVRNNLQRCHPIVLSL